MLLSAVSVLVVAQSSSEIPEGLTNNPVLYRHLIPPLYTTFPSYFILLFYIAIMRFGKQQYVIRKPFILRVF